MSTETKAPASNEVDSISWLCENGYKAQKVRKFNGCYNCEFNNDDRMCEKAPDCSPDKNTHLIFIKA